MKRTKRMRLGLFAVSLGLAAIACDLGDIGRPPELAGLTSTVDAVRQLEQRSTNTANTATAYVATQAILMLTGTIGPSATSTPCLLDEFGLCLPNILAERLVTARPEFNLPEAILEVRVGNRSFPFSSEPGEGFSRTVLGRFAAGTTLAVHKSVSGLPEGAEAENPEKDPCKDHYYGLYPVGWLELDIDVDDALALTTGIVHDWGGHADEEHAHLVDNQGRIIAQIDPYPGAQIIKVTGYSSDGTLVNVILQLVWIRADSVTAEGC